MGARKCNQISYITYILNIKIKISFVFEHTFVVVVVAAMPKDQRTRVPGAAAQWWKFWCFRRFNCVYCFFEEGFGSIQIKCTLEIRLLIFLFYVAFSIICVVLSSQNLTICHIWFNINDVFNDRFFISVWMKSYFFD